MANKQRTRVVFDTDVVLKLPIEKAWAELIDWRGHGKWIPMTRVDVDPTDPNRFTAWSGIGKLALEDRMLATGMEFDGMRGTCHVDKLGPVLVGFAELTVTTQGTYTRVKWHEEVTVPFLPGFLSPLVGATSGWFFGYALRRLAKTA
jgi:hypothetical protein